MWCQDRVLVVILGPCPRINPPVVLRIMSRRPELVNRVRELRGLRGWSQGDLAARTGLSRTGVGAIEAGRLVPSTAAALALAKALECRVEDLFRLPDQGAEGPAWAWPPSGSSSRFWAAEVGLKTWLYPVEPSIAAPPHDGVAGSELGLEFGSSGASSSLVVATCDPAVGLLAAELARACSVRLIPLPRSSLAALDLLGRGLVHAAGLHLGGGSGLEGNAEAVRQRLGPGFILLRVALWDEGVVFTPDLRLRSVSSALGRVWVGREAGSGARQCLDQLFEGRLAPSRMARDHRGVAEAVRSGWADVGVCLRLAGEEAGLGFLGVRSEEYSLCFPRSLEADPRLRALVSVVRSAPYRSLLDDLPGYDSSRAGEVLAVD